MIRNCITDLLYLYLICYVRSVQPQTLQKVAWYMLPSLDLLVSGVDWGEAIRWRTLVQLAKKLTLPLAMLRIGTIYYSQNCHAYLPVTPTLRSRRLMACEIDGLLCQTQVIVANCTTEDYTCLKYFWHLSNEILYRDLVCFVKRQTFSFSFSFSPKWPLTTIRWYFTGLFMTELKTILTVL